MPVSCQEQTRFCHLLGTNLAFFEAILEFFLSSEIPKRSVLKRSVLKRSVLKSRFFTRRIL